MKKQHLQAKLGWEDGLKLYGVHLQQEVGHVKCKLHHVV